MKFFALLLILSFSLGLRAQNDTLTDVQLIETFKNIHKTDQSNIKHQEIRSEIFKHNFDLIISIVKQQGFPQFKIEPKKKKDRYIINRATSITFFHILQTVPNKLLDRDVIALLKMEIEENRMPKHIIEDVLINWKKFTDEPNNSGAVPMSETTKKAYDEALKTLEITL